MSGQLGRQALCRVHERLKPCAGLLRQLIDELSQPEDVLGCSAALQTVAELAEALPAPARQTLGGLLVEPLLGLCSSGDESLQAQAWQVRALLDESAPVCFCWEPSS